MSGVKEIIRKIKKYKDVGFLLRIFFFALKLDFTPNHLLISQLDVSTKVSGQSKDKDEIIRYVNLCFLIRKKLGYRDACLKTSLILCAFLRRYGINAQVCFAAKKDNNKMQGHCWVEIGNQNAGDGWKMIFRYPALGNHVSVSIMDDHAQAYRIWKKQAVKNRILVHLDAHMDCNLIPEKGIDSILAVNTLKELNNLLEDPGYWDLSGKTKEQLIAGGNFIYAALREGMIKEFYWVVPDYAWNPAECAQILKNMVKKYPQAGMEDIKNIEISQETIKARFGSLPVICCRLLDLPVISEEVLLDIDLDFMLENGESSDKNVDKKPWIWPDELAIKIKEKGLKTDLITIASSVKDGFTPEKYRYFSGELAEKLRKVLFGEA